MRLGASAATPGRRRLFNGGQYRPELNSSPFDTHPRFANSIAAAEQSTLIQL
jgi:CTP synthase (UTP-ammonia lyase)